MNQENQQKPNLKRIGWIKEIHTEEGLSELNKKWENIQKGKISYSEDSLLEDLLKNEEYHLEAFLPDFRFMGFIFKERIEKEKRLKELNETIFKDLKIEYLQALKYLQENKKSEIKISTVTDSKGITIKNPELIDLIYKSLLEYADKADNISSWEELFKQAGMNLMDYIDYRLHIEKGKTSKRGRKIESYAIYTIVYFLRNYLQENTEIKAEAGAEYSNKQARFIFSFLEIHGLIDKLIEKKVTGEEDIILHYLRSYKKIRHIK